MEVAFYIGNMAVSWYGILTLLGTVFSFTFIYFRWKQSRYTKYHFWLLTTFTLLFALFGARWWYLMFHPQDWEGVISLFHIGSGRSIQGAVVFGGAFMFIYTTWISPDLDFRKVGSIVFPHILLGQAIGRWGNFTNQEVYGQVVNDLSWLPAFIQEGMFIEGALRQPLFLYESFSNIVGWILIAFVAYNIKWFKPGTHMAMYAIWYNISRLSMELYRDPEFVMNINGVPTSFIMTAILLCFGILSFIVYQFFFDRIASWNEFFAIERKKLFIAKWRLRFAYVRKRHTKENYETLLKVVRNRYNEYVKNIDKQKVEQYRKEINTWDK